MTDSGVVAESPLLVLVAVASFAIGGALVFWIGALRAAAREAAARERSVALEARAVDAAARADSVASLLEKTRGELAETQARNARLETTVEHERKTAETRLAEVKEVHERLRTEFKALSAQALESNNAAFLALARENLGAMQQQSLGELEKRQQAIDAVVRPLKESLEKVDGKIAEFDNARSRAYGQLSQQLEQLNASQLRLQSEAAKLSTALRSTQYVGSWGEIQLRRVVEMADMLPHVDFVEQTGTAQQRADMIIRLPGGQNIAVDAKTPVQNYREAVEAADDASRDAHLATHAAKVRGHIDALGAKSYWEQYQPSPEFVVLFMPGDHFLTAALQADPALLDRAISRGVLLATPTTLIALLKAASFGWRQEAVSRGAEEISSIGRQLYERIATFAEHLEKVGRGLEGATKNFNAAVGSFEQSLLPGARRFAELGARGSKNIAEPAPAETTVRELTKRE